MMPQLPKRGKRIDLWNTRTTSSGRFDEAKKSGDVFRGAKREDGRDLEPVIALAFLLTLALAGLILHSCGVFV